ncbi:hypothetical protein [Geminisphaera colitermitum]|uniref:hypothetical protein n=1 Tax=Geminisphaera colitermitum TaxID=1148786 RepID=UPI000158CAFA|nr:hypothetical protein [Geminisphaera colitermitum]
MKTPNKLPLLVTLVASLACGFSSFPALPTVQAQSTLYWTDSSTQWVTGPDLSTIPAGWASTLGGTKDQKWDNGTAEARNSAVIDVTSPNPEITIAPNDRAINVGTLTIANSATLVGGSGNTRFFYIETGGSGTLTLATTSLSTASNGSMLRLSGTSAWDGTIGTSASAGDANKNRIEITKMTAVGQSTTLSIDGARVIVAGNSGDVFTIGELKGAGGALRLNTGGAGQSKELVVNQSTDTTFAGVFEESVAAGTSVLTKQGEGSLTLGGANTIDQVNVNGGSLIVDGSISGDVSVAQGAKLGGTGSVGAVTLNNGAVIKFSLGAAQNLTASSLVKGTDGTYVFDFGGTGVAGETYTLSSVVGAGFEQSEFSAINLASGVTGAFLLSGSELKFVTSAAIPELSICALLAGGVILAGALILRRRHR